MRAFELKKIACFVLLSITLWGGGCVTVPPQDVSSAYLDDLCRQYYILYKFDDVSQVVTLIKGRVQAIGLVGDNSFLIEKEKIQLTGILRKDKDRIVVPSDFKDRIINRLIKEDISARPLSYTVVIDAGHGGKDPGAIGLYQVHEKKINLDIAQRLEKILAEKGVRVIMTRTRDDFISLAQRTEIASVAKADIFVSIHANSNPSRKMSGMEVWIPHLKGQLSDLEDQQKRNFEILFTKLNILEDNSTVKWIVADMLLHAKKTESYNLASFISQKMGMNDQARNIGIKKSEFFVVRNTVMPAVLIEVGFLSNSQENKMLQDAAYRQKLAYFISEGILTYATYH